MCKNIHCQLTKGAIRKKMFVLKVWCYAQTLLNMGLAWISNFSIPIYYVIICCIKLFSVATLTRPWNGKNVFQRLLTKPVCFVDFGCCFTCIKPISNLLKLNCIIKCILQLLTSNAWKSDISHLHFIRTALILQCSYAYMTHKNVKNAKNNTKFALLYLIRVHLKFYQWLPVFSSN